MPQGFRVAVLGLLCAIGFSAGAYGQDGEESDSGSFGFAVRAIKCSPKILKGEQPLVLTFGSGHGGELEIEREADHTRYILIEHSPPPPMKSLMSPDAFAAAHRLVLPMDTAGYRWDDGKGIRERIFSKPGRYIVYTSDNFESDLGGFKCAVRYVR